MALDSLVVLSIAFGLLSMLSYGLTDYISKLLTKRTSPIKMTVWYFSLSAIVLAVVGLFFFKLPQLSLFDVILLVMTSVIGVIALFAFLKGLKVGKLAIVAPISGSWSVITVLIGVLLLNEVVNFYEEVGIILIIVGTILSVFRYKDITHVRFNRLISGVDYALITMVLWGMFYAGIGVLSEQLGWFWPVFVILALGSFLLLIYTSLKGTDISFPKNVLSLMFLYVVIGTAAFIFYSVGTSYGSLALVSPIAAAAPFIAVILALLLLKEKLEVNQIFGIAAIIIGLILIAY